METKRLFIPLFKVLLFFFALGFPMKQYAQGHSSLSAQLQDIHQQAATASSTLQAAANAKVVVDKETVIVNMISTCKQLFETISQFEPAMQATISQTNAASPSRRTEMAENNLKIMLREITSAYKDLLKAQEEEASGALCRHGDGHMKDAEASLRDIMYTAEKLEGYLQYCQEKLAEDNQ